MACMNMNGMNKEVRREIINKFQKEGLLCWVKLWKGCGVWECWQGEGVGWCGG